MQSKEFNFELNEVVLAKFGKEVYYAKILAIDRVKRSTMLLFDDNSTEEHPFENVYSVNETTSEIICVICKEDSTRDDNEIVLCDKCSIGFHQHCHRPAIGSEVLSPETPWECGYCEHRQPNPYIQSNPFEEKERHPQPQQLQQGDLFKAAFEASPKTMNHFQQEDQRRSLNVHYQEEVLKRSNGHYQEDQQRSNYFEEEKRPNNHFQEEEIPNNNFKEEKMPNNHFQEENIPNNNFQEEQRENHQFPEEQRPNHHFEEEQKPNKNTQEEGRTKFQEEMLTERYKNVEQNNSQQQSDKIIEEYTSVVDEAKEVFVKREEEDYPTEEEQQKETEYTIAEPVKETESREEKEAEEQQKEAQHKEKETTLNPMNTSPFRGVVEKPSPKRASKLDEIFKEQLMQCSHHDMVNNNSSYDYIYSPSKEQQCRHSDLMTLSPSSYAKNQLTTTSKFLSSKATAQVSPLVRRTSNMDWNKMLQQETSYDKLRRGEPVVYNERQEKPSKSTWLIQQLRKSSLKPQQQNNDKNKQLEDVNHQLERKEEEIKILRIETFQHQLEQQKAESTQQATTERKNNERNSPRQSSSPAVNKESKSASPFKPTVLIDTSTDERKSSPTNRYRNAEEFDLKMQQEKFNELHRGKSSIQPLILPIYESLSRDNTGRGSPKKLTRHGSLPNIPTHFVKPSSPLTSATSTAVSTSTSNVETSKHLLANPHLLNQSVSKLLNTSTASSSSTTHQEPSPSMSPTSKQRLLEEKLALYDQEIQKLKTQQQMLLQPQQQQQHMQHMKNRAMLEMENQLRLAEAVRVKELINMQKTQLNPMLQQAMQMEALNNNLNGQMAIASPMVINQAPNPMQLHPFVRNNQIIMNNQPSINLMNEMRCRNALLKNNHLTEREMNALALADLQQKERRSQQLRITPQMQQAAVHSPNISTPTTALMINHLDAARFMRGNESKSDPYLGLRFDRAGLKRPHENAFNIEEIKRRNISPTQVFKNGKLENSTFKNATFNDSTDYGTPYGYQRSSPTNKRQTNKHQCNLCREESQFICSACREAWYCSQKCQLTDWKSHAKLCKSSRLR